MEDQAASCIQARVRGFQCRKKQRRGIRAVTKLQALQRGRFTRREFAELRDFSREQESLQQATRRRQTRIWRNEQELYFLQHTNAVDLERVRAFQQHHAARLIQRAWRATTQSAGTSNGKKPEVVDPISRVFTFDPFDLTNATQWSHDTENSANSQRPPSPFLSKEELHFSGSARQLPVAISNDEAFASRRKAIQERIKRKGAQEKAKTESASKPKSSVSYVATESSKSVASRRRELYEKVVAMKRTTAQRVLQYDRETRASRPKKELRSAQLISSCENRIKHLQAERPEQMIPSEESNQQVDAAAQWMQKWDSARRLRVWNHHSRAVVSVLEKRNWWQTQLAGGERDIRKVIVAKSPWEDEHKIWVWPRNELNNQDEHGSVVGDKLSASQWPSMEIHRFLVGDEEPQTPVSDAEASEWWSAHCTQSHLASNGALVIDNRYRAEFSNNITSEGDVFPVCTSEMVANRELYDLQQRAKRAARTKTLEDDVEQRMKNLKAQVERRVHEMETQVEANTQFALEMVRRKEEKQVRITREQQSVVTIQRHARGMLGRRCARERRAEFFVMVRGRAIRRGRCEECGDQRAVLECQQCEESVHFCPICWVHVHSTRRRKTHVAIPMTTVVAPTPVRDVESTTAPILVEAPADSSRSKLVVVKSNSGPKLQPIPSPRKQDTIRSADSAGVKAKNTEIDTNRSAISSKMDSFPTSKPLESSRSRKNTTPELAEACALARRVRAQAAETPSTAEETNLVAAQHGALSALEDTPPQVSGRVFAVPVDNDELDFSTVDGDGAMVSDAEAGREEQQSPAKINASVVEEMALLQAAAPPESNETPSAHDLLPDASSDPTADVVAENPTESAGQESAPIEDPNGNAGSDTNNTLHASSHRPEDMAASSAGEQGGTNNSSISATAEAEVSVALYPASNDAPTAADQVCDLSATVQNNNATETVATEDVDVAPSGESAEQELQQGS